MTEWNVVFKASVKISARSKNEAITKARAEVAKYAIKHLACEYAEKS